MDFEQYRIATIIDGSPIDVGLEVQLTLHGIIERAADGKLSIRVTDWAGPTTPPGLPMRRLSR